MAPLPKPGARTIGHGTQAGVVYRLTNGQLVYVQQASPGTDSLNGLPLGPAHAGAIPLIAHGDPYIMGLLWVTIRVAVVSTVGRAGRSACRSG